MYNKVILSGNLSKDIEIRYTNSGSAIGNTSIAVNRKFKSATGEQKEEVLFIDLIFFGRTAEIANQYLRKGSKVLVDGRLKLDNWTAQDGSKRSKHSVIVESLQMLGSRDENTQPQQQQQGYTVEYAQPQQSYAQQSTQQQPQQSYTQSRMPEMDITENEIPF